ncbi:hypothetical protein BBBOND_0204270 [Babesia bigemina]|uniref:Uncharacterized protein n=1 Tax=Babesia bigemina TaxID=5866 RepID=A0A061D8N4_BABBI|nr:hypothetical protein BBBOND_0204270 [Babesia bigemina]CDR95269.1 hypothetical protein BBBOND_0204270 [Babesia bigemina]|eukprot:XP_012767455.1 hypothetical protein BBBOND_0204270 [Babesia bigemina]
MSHSNKADSRPTPSIMLSTISLDLNISQMLHWPPPEHLFVGKVVPFKQLESAEITALVEGVIATLRMAALVIRLHVVIISCLLIPPPNHRLAKLVDGSII